MSSIFLLQSLGILCICTQQIHTCALLYSQVEEARPANLRRPDMISLVRRHTVMSQGAPLIRRQRSASAHTKVSQTAIIYGLSHHLAFRLPIHNLVAGSGPLGGGKLRDEVLYLCLLYTSDAADD